MQYLFILKQDMELSGIYMQMVSGVSFGSSVNQLTKFKAAIAYKTMYGYVY
jgi:hypothetical protein